MYFSYICRKLQQR